MIGRDSVGGKTSGRDSEGGRDWGCCGVLERECSNGGRIVG
jgi:hypothetical protein